MKYEWWYSWLAFFWFIWFSLWQLIPAIAPNWLISSYHMSLCLCYFACSVCLMFHTLRPRRNEQHFADDIFKRILFNANVWISIKISLKFVPKGPINNIPALVQIRAWRRSGEKPLSEPMMVSLPTHMCVTRPQWVNATLWQWNTSLFVSIL